MFIKGQHVMFSKLPGVYIILSSKDVSVQIKVRNVKQRASKRRVYTIQELLDKRGIKYEAFDTELEPVNVVRNRSGKSHIVPTALPRCNAIVPEVESTQEEAGAFLAFVSTMRNETWF